MALTQAQLAEVAAWVETYAAQTEALSAQTTAAMLSSVYSSPAAWSAAGASAAATQAADLSGVATATASGMAAQYLALSTAASIGTSVPIPNFPVPPIRAGKDMVDVFERVFRVYERQVRKRGDVQRALRIAMRYAYTLTDANVRMTQAQTYHQVLDYLAPRIGINGYRRVVHPELSRTGTCGLCIVASNNVYKNHELLPLHANCKCTILPIIGDVDPGGSLNNLSLEDVYSAARDRPNARRATGTHEADLKAVRFKVVDHTEHGPTLVDADHAFTPMGSLVRSDDPDARQRRTGSTTPGTTRVPKPTQEQVDAAREEALADIAKFNDVMAQIAGIAKPSKPLASSDRSDSQPGAHTTPAVPAGPAGPGVPPAGPGGPDGPDGPDEYPDMPDGEKVPFLPSRRPALDDWMRAHILERHADTEASRTAFPKKDKFPGDWSADRIFAAVDTALALPDRAPVRLGDKIRFERVVDGILVRVQVRTDGDEPVIWNAYPVGVRA